tara:strand:- start:153 stop:431 length:279 start_codon:yes stop_codon:yes gene_type:complete
MTTIDKDTAIKMIKNSDGRIFGVSFIKRTTGELRHMSARRGVRKGVNGEGLKYDPESKQLITVYDMNKEGHRMLNTETLYRLSLKGMDYNIV